MLSVRVKKGKEKNIQKGFPWVYSGDINRNSELIHAVPGELVRIVDWRDNFLGIGYYNDKSKITCRIISRNEREKIDKDFFVNLIRKAMKKRDSLFGEPYYRLIHSEPDGIAGLVVDRFDRTLVCQFSTAGIDRLKNEIMLALEEVLAPVTVILRNDFPSRTLEGLPRESVVVKGNYKPYTKVLENDCWYFADLLQGQKTGWFYDQRDNRRIMAEESEGKTVLDVYSHSGGFGIVAAKKGAEKVVMVDSSALALELARKTAEENDVTASCEYIEGDAFAVMEKLDGLGKRFDVVIADPPAFVRSKKDIASGLKGYEKVARLSAKLVERGGQLYVASCSHHAGKHQFVKAVEEGVKKAGRKGRVIDITGASADHPVHPMLRQNEYLKAVIMQID